MQEMKLCGEYILLEKLKDMSDNSTFKLPETIKIHERFQHSKVIKVSDGKSLKDSEKEGGYNICCKPGDTVVFRASVAEQIIDPFSQITYLLVKNSDIISVYGGNNE